MFNFTIKHGYDLETKQYIVEIPELNLSDYGDTLVEALSNLEGAMNLYFEEMSLTKKESNNKSIFYA
ncbi:MAG: hypothetical protein PHR68_04475 [Candidatus Gracilibacteria bacterium]|nr:hypothetical protein [Candidatus Gracilibacteria bacterium]